MSLNYQESDSLHSRQRPMYHYLYGSVGNSPPPPPPPSEVEANTNSAAHLLNTSVESGVSLNTVDQESLVGEGLIATDTEPEDEADKAFRSRDGDFEQLLMTNGTEGMPSFLGRSIREKDKRKPWGYLILSPALYFVALLMLVAILSCAIALVVFPNRSILPFSGGTATRPATSEASFRMPFPRADRMDYGDPVDKFMVKDLFHSELHYKGTDPSRVFTFPFPTGAFWTNLVLPPTTDQGLSYPIIAYPYGFKWSDTLMQISYSYGHRKEDAISIHDYFITDLTFSCEEDIIGRHITAFDSLSVSLQYETANKGLWSAFIVQGSPYINMEYGSITPTIKARSTFLQVGCPPEANTTFVGNKRRRLDGGYGVCYTETDNSTGLQIAHGVQFILTTAEGWHWIIFTSEPVTLEFDTRVRTLVKASETYNGVFRAAIIPSNTTLEDLSMSSGLQRLINHAGTYPVNADINWIFGQSSGKSTNAKGASQFAWTGESSANQTLGRVATISMKFQTRTFVPTSSAAKAKPLLMLALPHQALRLSPNVLLGPKGFDLTFYTIKGQMTPVLGASWTYDQPLLDPGFDNDSGSNVKQMFLDPTVNAALVENLKQDISIALPTKTENIYGFGKQSARLAQLCHVASKLLESQSDASGNSSTTTNGTDSVASILKQATKRLSYALEALFTGEVSDQLIYDSNLGGMVTTDGLLDSGADFGNGRYNDHHFHYGYVLYASAIMAKLDDDFLQTYKSHIDSIYFDVAHDANYDSRRRGEGVFFPAARHMNWYDGHSYASGMFPFGNGKSQESSSEAVNCYYGAYLWSLVRNGAAKNPVTDTTSQTDFTRLLLSTEISGAQTYWHMIPQSQSNLTSGFRPKIYSEKFTQNYMVGNVGMNDVICSTWFGTKLLYVHMINFLPVTSAVGELFSYDYAKLAYKNVLASIGEIDAAWRGFVVADHAISDPNAAWKEAQQLSSPTLDSGLSKTQLLYFISTRKGFETKDQSPNSTSNKNFSSKQFSDSSSTENEQQSSTIYEDTSSGSSDCQANSMCVTTNLEGKCCPTSSGIMLDCCD